MDQFAFKILFYYNSFGCFTIPKPLCSTSSDPLTETICFKSCPLYRWAELWLMFERESDLEFDRRQNERPH